jgi:hypothetical protein
MGVRLAITKNTNEWGYCLPCLVRKNLINKTTILKRGTAWDFFSILKHFSHTDSHITKKRGTVLRRPKTITPWFYWYARQDSNACRNEAEIPRHLGDAGRPTDSETEISSFLTSSYLHSYLYLLHKRILYLFWFFPFLVGFGNFSHTNSHTNYYFTTIQL